MSSIKAEIAPKGLEFKPSEFIVSDKYATILSVISYPKFIYPGYLSSLTSMSGIKLVIKHIPLPFSSMSKMLNKELADLKQRYQDENDRTIQERIRQDYESLEQFISELAASQAKIYDFQMHIMITADSKEELELKKLQIRNYLESMEVKAIPLRFEQLQWQLCIHLYLIVLKIQGWELYLVLTFLVVLYFLTSFCIKLEKKVIEIMLI